MSFIEYIPHKCGSGEGSLFSTIVDTYYNLPTGGSYINTFAYVKNGSGGFLSGIGLYKYPQGVYTTSDGTLWELSIIQVELSEDSTTLVNIDNWHDFLSTGVTFSIGDRVVYDKIQYQNLTGASSSNDPSIDLTNWSSEGTLGNAETVTNGVYTVGNQTIDGIKTFAEFPVTPSSDPSNNYEVSNKKYVDDSVIELSGIDKTLNYNIVGALDSVVSANGTKTMIYDINNILVGIVGTGKYKSKTFVYTDGKLTSVIVN
jgi:hypothetical protein